MKKQIWSVGAAAALAAFCASGAIAQDNTTAPVQPAAFTPLNLPTITAPPAMDYKVLIGQPFTYSDLEAARRSGLSDREVAMIANVAKMTGLSFHIIRDDVLCGQTFPSLAEEYSLNLFDVYNTDDEMQTIQNYKDAVHTTGWWAMRNTQMNGSPYSMDMGSGGMMNNGSGMNNGGGMTPAPAPSPMVQPSSDTSATSGTMAPSGSVVDVINATPRLSMLAKAIQSAGLADTLNGAGPFTIFAPDNAAFRHVPKRALNQLMANPTALASLLQYHVISGQKIDAATAMSMTSPTSPATLQGGTLQVTTSNGKVMINDATVVQPDIQASNGIIHIINRVLMPAPGTGAGQ